MKPIKKVLDRVLEPVQSVRGPGRYDKIQDQGSTKTGHTR